MMGLLAGAGFIIRFYNLGHRLHLLVGLAFFVSGAEDFVHGFLPFAEGHGWIVLPAEVLTRSIPATYTSGRLLMAALLILAPLLHARLGKPRNPKLETVWASLIVLAVTVAGTVAAFHVELPALVFPLQVISRPVDFASAVLFVIALAIFLREYHRTGDEMTWWVALSIGLSAIGQVMMSFSREFYDLFFDVAHVYKTVGYALPILGFSLYQNVRNSAVGADPGDPCAGNRAPERHPPLDRRRRDCHRHRRPDRLDQQRRREPDPLGSPGSGGQAPR